MQVDEFGRPLGEARSPKHVGLAECSRKGGPHLLTITGSKVEAADRVLEAALLSVFRNPRGL